MLAAVSRPTLVSVQTFTINISFKSWQLDLQFTEFLALILLSLADLLMTKTFLFLKRGNDFGNCVDSC